MKSSTWSLTGYVKSNDWCEFSVQIAHTCYWTLSNNQSRNFRHQTQRKQVWAKRSYVLLLTTKHAHLFAITENIISYVMLNVIGSAFNILFAILNANRDYIAPNQILDNSHNACILTMAYCFIHKYISNIKNFVLNTLIYLIKNGTILQWNMWHIQRMFPHFQRICFSSWIQIEILK